MWNRILSTLQCTHWSQETVKMKTQIWFQYTTGAYSFLGVTVTSERLLHVFHDDYLSYILPPIKFIPPQNIYGYAPGTQRQLSKKNIHKQAPKWCNWCRHKQLCGTKLLATNTQNANTNTILELHIITSYKHYVDSITFL